MSRHQHKYHLTLISADVLANGLSHLKILDCRAQLGNPDHGLKVYTSGHIRNAQYASLDADFAAVRMDGAVELITQLLAAGFTLAVGSSGPPPNVEIALEGLGVREAFGAVVTGADVVHGKPDPQVFRLAAERLGADPGECVVIEDAPAGVMAATAAGMASVAVLSTGRQASDFDGVEPSLVVASITTLTPQVLAELL